MDQKLLTENGWKAIALKSKIKDNGLQRALAAYERLDDDEHEDRIKAIAAVSQLAGALKRTREVAAAPDVVDYLDDVVSTAESEKREITKAKGLAEKTQALAAKAEAAAGKKAEAEEKKKKQDDEEEEAASDYRARLLAAFQKLKNGNNLSYEFIVCDAKPHCGVMLARRITSQHKEELTDITGGSKRFLPPGTCHFEDGHFVFSMEHPVTGLARKLQDSVKQF